MSTTSVSVKPPAPGPAGSGQSSGPTSVLVLGGGPDAEREVSLTSARFVADAIDASPGLRAIRETIDRLTPEALRALPGDVIFPVLHGGWGEGGPLQDLLEKDGRPFVGSGSRAARLAMDKVATKAAALRAGIPTPEARILDLRDGVCPLPLPVVIKPVHEGSTIGLHVADTPEEWERALEAIRSEQSRAAVAGAGGGPRAYMVEARIAGRELTVGIVDDDPLPIIEITPAGGLYDYAAKYTRDDTRYTLDPDLPRGVGDTVKAHAVKLAYRVGVRHLARVDFILDVRGVAWMLEINTMPGFTDHSLVPMAARHAGMSMSALCARLVGLAVRDAASAGRN